MARVVEPTPEEEAGYREWVRTRPPAVRAVAERFEPWSLYRLKTSGHRVTIVSFGKQEDGTVTLKVRVTGEFNRVLFDRDVFGVDPNELEPCELPAADEPLGTELTHEEFEAKLPVLREMMRRDRPH